MGTSTSRKDDKDAGCPSLYTEPPRLDKYNILELARLPSITREAMVEDWLESVYGKTTAPAKVPWQEFAPERVFEHGSDKPLETGSNRGCSPSEGRVLASRPPTSPETSGPCDVDTTFTERKIYKWRKWATESV
ncbi:MAG: hypothetical protein ALECFALPRED_006442 [Alectoria fallacina]|uniref:Uncharacterized protein n=1 Tax=Alectoria fallacina TaxID=1903189 RepID=A0A8H3EQH5_9LECA|nr:MAG: hypothetical protein ALECFALPRED_006442 [Alectoria fallacina]